MSASINFLSERRKKLTKQQVLDHKIFRIMTGVGIGISLVLFLSIGARIILARNLIGITQKQQQMLQVVRSQEESEKSYIIFAAKLRVISELFVQRRDKQEAINYFSTLFGPDVLISDIAYEADTGNLTFGLEAKNVFTLDKVYDLLNSDEVTDQFSLVKATELRRDKYGIYSTSVLVVMSNVDKAENN